MRNLNFDCDRVRSVTAKELRLPKSRSKYPLAFLSDELIQDTASFLSKYPEKRGRLSEAILLACGTKPDRPIEYTILESHIDINTVDLTTSESLVRIGFDPDDFFRLHPECYLRHFTLQFIVDTSNVGRIDAVRSELEERTERALRFLRMNNEYFGYIESEIYTSNAICVGKGETLTSDCIDAIASAFDRYRFERREISNFMVARDGELPHETVKAADLHIKYKKSKDLSQSLSIGKVDKLLADQGLYEIISEAGNSIYTGQFLTANYARSLFEELKAIIITNNAPMTVCWEPCISFVRFGHQVHEGISRNLSPVPPILLRRSP
jgi:hypothetical protein